MRITRKELRRLLKETLLLTELFDNLKPYPFQEERQADWYQFVYTFVTKDNLNYKVTIDIVYNDEKTAPESWDLSFTIFHPDHPHIEDNIMTNKLDMSVYATIVEIFKQMHFIDKPRKLKEKLISQYKLNGQNVSKTHSVQRYTQKHIDALRINQYSAYAFDHNPKRLRIYASLLRKNGALDVIVDKTALLRNNGIDDETEHEMFELKWKGPELPDPELF